MRFWSAPLVAALLGSQLLAGNQGTGGRAAQGGTAGTQGGPPRVTLPSKPVVPVAASTLIARPDAYVGEPVSLAAIVDAHLSPVAFAVDHQGGRTADAAVLVLAPTLQRAPDVDTAVTVIGEVARLDPAALASRLPAIDLPADAVARYAGKIVIFATSVVDRAGVDLARRLPPPMTAEDAALQPMMKQAAAARGGLQKAIEAADGRAAAEHSAHLRKTFAAIETFWKGRRQADAARLAADVRRHSETAERAAVAARWDEVKSAVASASTACQSCHDVHRERFDDGSFRIKRPGTR